MKTELAIQTKLSFSFKDVPDKDLAESAIQSTES